MSHISDVKPQRLSALADSVVGVRYRRAEGVFADTTLDRVRFDEVLSGLPVREFRSYRGRKHYSGWYFSSTTGGHVVYESRLELGRILLADQDPGVVGIAAQPFVLEGFDGERIRRHVPDLLLEHVGGGLTIVDVKPARRCGDPKVVAQFAWTGSLCAAYGLGFEVWSGCDPVWLENIRFLAGYRRKDLIDPAVVSLVRETVAGEWRIGDLERALDAPARRALVRPAVLHLLWSGALIADFSRPLDGESVVGPVLS